MTHEDYERAANHWKIKDASDEKSGQRYINERNRTVHKIE